MLIYLQTNVTSFLTPPHTLPPSAHGDKLHGQNMFLEDQRSRYERPTPLPEPNKTDNKTFLSATLSTFLAEI